MTTLLDTYFLAARGEWQARSTFLRSDPPAPAALLPREYRERLRKP
jgi:hypothetical protein